MALKATLSSLILLPLALAAPQAATTTSSAEKPTRTTYGTAANCDDFYQVQYGDYCAEIESKFDITAAEFTSWNPSINSDCTNLQATYYYCVGVSDDSASKAKRDAPTATSDAVIETPTSTQSGMIGDCNKFYDVEPQDTCRLIAGKEFISLDDFYSWNPSVGSSCENLLEGYWVCVGVEQ